MCCEGCFLLELEPTERMEEEKGPQLQIAFQEIILALTSNKKDALKKIKYLKIKHTSTGHLSETRKRKRSNSTSEGRRAHVSNYSRDKMTNRIHFTNRMSIAVDLS